MPSANQVSLQTLTSVCKGHLGRTNFIVVTSTAIFHLPEFLVETLLTSVTSEMVTIVACLGGKKWEQMVTSGN